MGVLPKNWEQVYKRDFERKGGNVLRQDLLQLDTFRTDYQSQKDEYQRLYDERLAAFNAGDNAYAVDTEGNPYTPRTLKVNGREVVVNSASRAFSPGDDLQSMQRNIGDLENRIKALEYYDARMPEAGQVRQAQRELDATTAGIQARREDEHRKREELRRLRISPRDVKTTERGILGGE